MAIDIQELSLDEVMGDRFGRYSKYIIQDRALPDIRDGLKPVQRRILYAMYHDGNTSDHAFRKSAKTVGNVIGNYHPHGDSSVYEAMVRMSQAWKNRMPLIDMHGNNGSMDGDPAAAMRYTEARLSKLADELLKDLNKDTVDTILNFDDTEEEPVVLPAGFPNLLVNGSQGISAGYATEIPTHNLGEVIDAVNYYIDHPKAKVETLMKYLPGPDFPTGGIIQGKDQLIKAYKTGRGKVVVRAQTEVESLKAGRKQIVITELPFEVNKADLVRKMDELRLNRSIDGVMEVRDESDRSGLRIIVELKKDADADQILQYYFKHTNLQINYNFNMVAINKQRPEQVGLIAIIQAYIDHRKDVVSRRTQYDLNKAQSRRHIVDGLIKAISILDQVITIIRNSSDKKDAKNNLISEYQFSQAQAEAIVTLQLYRLTNTDITALQEEKLSLNEAINQYQAILSDETILMKLIQSELKAIKKAYATDRLTKIEAEVEEIKIKKEFLIPDEEVVTVVTRGGYIKRSSLRSYQSSNFADLGLRDGDHVLYLAAHSTLDNLVLITNKGNYIFQPVYEMQELRWKDLGEHLSQRIPIASDEKIIQVYPYAKDSQDTIVLATREGMIKQSKLSELKKIRGHKNKASQIMPLSSPLDEVVNCYLVNNQSDKQNGEVILFTALGFSLRYQISEINTVGLRAKGVISINLKDQDQVVNFVYQDQVDEDQQILLATQRGYMKRMRWRDIQTMTRAKRGLMVLREVKSKPHRLVQALEVESTQEVYELYTSNGELSQIKAVDVPLHERYSNGSQIIDEGRLGELLDVIPLYRKDPEK
ncbi:MULTISPECIES: DNA topoisomerase IV subunit A [Aerococcus]|uniref:DNA topoisomerase IV subunit A n=1 Tax=Aerococcus urinae (strain CCUG 59500 / ACS-120-V-Col10a) TaxID=2976812 RepID=UPI000200EC17|nr:DNA topoisomerase IV subunit A [Aerococcus sp. Group 1]AEA01728.1 DNA topoisomerase IV, A subunit [Aerococcus sp. Group 1]MCY3030504.1 DNA topoisomerase IV subunit A [Aerococcus sp. Group 1]MCY3054548.1 DNA topoisomerase IV subunit A [Aerococcus sp. Group 1]MCY3056278.1 DNA topoisomerase IV subunit A [Aerococcus sp. Group 1]MCY3061735.1 DNA topoisomerase IV subunit A [Aerococcus sp. Group 1]